MRNHCQIMAHQNDGQALRHTQPTQQVQDFRLHADIKRAGRFIQQQHLRFQHQRARNGHTLALPAGKLIWIAETKIRP